jgi:phosphatidylserine decarboxylase
MLARAGRPFLLTVGVADAVVAEAYYFYRIPVILVGVVALSALFVLFLQFFRDPERAPAKGIVAAADGKILLIEREGKNIRVGTFMNVTNVHVNRVPYPGYLVRVDDRQGKKRPAFSPKASGNAQKRYLCGTPIGVVEVVQITGLIARRCVAYKHAGSTLSRGERMGMVLFGSRVDVVLPADKVKVLVHVGDGVRANSTAIAEPLPW